MFNLRIISLCMISFLILNCDADFKRSKDENKNRDFLPILLLYFSRGSTNNVYIDPSAEENGNGSKNSPYNTFNGIVFQKNTSYLIKRGTVLYEQITMNASGSASRPIVIGAYGTGSKPVIDGSELVDEWNSSGDIYSSTLAPTEEYGRGNVTINGAIQEITTGTPSDGEYSITGGGEVSIFGDPSGKNIRLSRRYFGIKGVRVSNITIKDLHIRQASLHGIHFEDSENIIIQNCRIEISGGAYIGSLQAGNGIEFGDSSSKGRVFNSIITDIFDSGISPQTYSHNKNASDFIFSGNTIKRCGFAGIEIAALYNDGNANNSSISDVIIEDNEISLSGKGWSGIRYSQEGRGIKINADIDGSNNTRFLSGIVVRRCIIKENAGEGIHISGRSGIVHVSRSLISSNDRGGIGLQEAEPTNLGLKLSSSIIRENSTSSNDGVSVNTVSTTGDIHIYHNTFYDNGRFGLNLNGSVENSQVSNNIFHSSNLKVHLYTEFILSSARNNFFREFSGDIIGYDGSAYQSASSFNSSERSGNIGGDNPGLVSTSNLRISNTSSVCYRSGTSGIGVTKDYSGKRFYSTPSIGAYEF